MTQYLILPLGGVGQRFIDAGYKTYKPFLKVSKNNRIIDKIVSNFPKKKTKVIVIGNEKKFRLIKSNLKKNILFIKIKNHKYGPLYSIFLANKELKGIIKDSKFFIVYSDINWNWKFQHINKFIKYKKLVVFTHKGYHPDLETNTQSDFCSINQKNYINKISEKKLIFKDYKKNLLAIGCYYFCNYKFLETFFKKNKLCLRSKTKEYYLVSLINFLIKEKIKVNFYNLKNFVHLGVPSQYENFINWKKILVYNFKKNLKLNFSNIMLMAGKGTRVKALKQKKPFLKIKNQKIYDYIFKKYGTENNSIITNNNYYNGLDKKYKIFKIKNSKSMLQTVDKSLKFLSNQKNYFITSCDCFGIFSGTKFKRFIKNDKPDVVLFAFKFTDLQKKNQNSHSSIAVKNNNIVSIDVKKNSKQNKFGHAGFFWVKNSKVFNLINQFKLKKKINREMLLDDYFKYLFDFNKFKIKCFILDNYVHIGSLNEYNELKYWENYFKNEN